MQGRAEKLPFIHSHRPCEPAPTPTGPRARDSYYVPRTQGGGGGGGVVVPARTGGATTASTEAFTSDRPRGFSGFREGVTAHDHLCRWPCSSASIGVKGAAPQCSDSTWRVACRTWNFSRSSVRAARSEEHTSELQSLVNLVCRLLLEKKKEKEENKGKQKRDNNRLTESQSAN